MRPLPLMMAILGAATAMAQDRVVHEGVVLDPQGRPLPGAAVVFAAAADRVAGRESGDRVEVQTDADGAWRAALLPNVSYGRWVLGPLQDGRSAVVPAEFVALAASGNVWQAEHAVGRTPLRISGLDAWRDHGPFHLRLSLAAGVPVTEIPCAQDGVLTLPPLPCDVADASVVDRTGRVIVARTIVLEQQREIACAPVVEVAFRVVDRRGRPVAGVRILDVDLGHGGGLPPLAESASLGRHEFEVAVSDAHGAAKARFAASALAEGIQRFLAVAPNGDAGFAGFSFGSRFENGRDLGSDGVLDAAGPVPLQIVVAPGCTYALRVRGAPRDVDLVAWLEAEYQVADDEGFVLLEHAFVSDVQAVRKDVARVVLPPAPSAAWCIATRDGTVRARLDANVEQATLVWSELRTRSMRTVDAEGRPVAGVRVGFHPDARMPITRYHGVGVTDAAGVVTMSTLWQQAPTWAIYARAGDAHGFVLLGQEERGDVRIVMEPFVDVAVRVVDGKGGAVGGAVVEVGVSEEAAEDARVEHAMLELPRPFFRRVTGGDGVARARLPKEVVPLLTARARFDGRVGPARPLQVSGVELVVRD
jgi:hypothetical protein